MFGVTRKKAGWDCMRHLEIMAAGCIPYFIDLESLPRLTMQFYPKQMLAEAMSLKGVTLQGEDTNPESFNVDLKVLNFDKYYELATRILEHSRKHLTTSAMARYLLQTVSKDGLQPYRVLMATNCIDDYGPFAGERIYLPCGADYNIDDCVDITPSKIPAGEGQASMRRVLAVHKLLERR